MQSHLYFRRPGHSPGAQQVLSRALWEPIAHWRVESVSGFDWGSLGEVWGFTGF